jgi:hypothetical protein
MNPEPCAVAPAFRASGHIGRDLNRIRIFCKQDEIKTYVKIGEPIPNTCLVDAEDYEIFGLYGVNVRNGRNSECAAFGIVFTSRVEFFGWLTRAGPVALTNVTTRQCKVIRRS